MTNDRPHAAAIPVDAAAEADLVYLAEQAEALRRAGRAEAAALLMAWRDLHARRHGLAPAADGEGRDG